MKQGVTRTGCGGCGPEPDLAVVPFVDTPVAGRDEDTMVKE